MKKLYLLSLITLLFFGCSSSSDKELKTKKCSFVSDQSASGYVSTTNYTINYEDELVDNVETIETIESSDKNILKFFKDQLGVQYKNSNDLYGGYSYNIKEEENKVIITLNIDYKELDMEKFLNDNSGMKVYLNNNNKLTIDGIIKMYTNIGVVCE